NGSHASTLKSPSYTKSVSWQHYRLFRKWLSWQKPISWFVTSVLTATRRLLS
ncbi:transposase, partial [Shigella flexneri]